VPPVDAEPAQCRGVTARWPDDRRRHPLKPRPYTADVNHEVASDPAAITPSPPPLVVQYLYVHGREESFFYPQVRARRSAAAVAERYLECALVQAATLSLRGTDCELALAMNLSDAGALTRRADELLSALESHGVELLDVPYEHAPTDGSSVYRASRYVIDAIVASASRQPPSRQLVFTDLDCVWVAPERLFARIPSADGVACIHIEYPPDWDVVGFGEDGRTRVAIGQLARGLGVSAGVPLWIGGELLAGSAESMLGVVAECEEVDRALAEQGRSLPTEEQVFSLLATAGRVRFIDLFDIARRIQTGPRHEAPIVDDPTALALWHLPSEKGLSLRRTAGELVRGRDRRLTRDLRDPSRLARRFNVAGTGWSRRIKDDSWIAATRARGVLAGMI
jgi:hypothetical protein